jgi:hypothetical protein
LAGFSISGEQAGALIYSLSLISNSRIAGLVRAATAYTGYRCALLQAGLQGPVFNKACDEKMLPVDFFKRIGRLC